MRTRVITVDAASPDPTLVAEAAAVLRGGGLVAFPTETVYGLGAHALDARAVERIFEAKGRPASDPLIVHVADSGDLDQLVRVVPAAARDLARRFWPGPLTLVLPKQSRVPAAVTAGLDTVAVRLPSHPVARALLLAAGVPIAAPSANLFSRPSPTSAAHVLEDLDGRIDVVVDGGSTTVGVESTVLDLTSDPPAVLRPGGITLEALRAAIPAVVLRIATAEASGAQVSPGRLPLHYAPRTPLWLFEGDPSLAIAALHRAAAERAGRGERVAVLVSDEQAARFDGADVIIGTLGAWADQAVAAARLFALLRDLDAASPSVILAIVPPAHGLGLAVADRLRRAAGGHIVTLE